MKYDPEIHHRRSIRLRGYDYAQPGAYSVTLCTQGKAHWFGEVVEGEMKLNGPGRMVESWWNQLNRKYQTVRTDEFVVMPNHVHGIIRIVGADVGAIHQSPLQRPGKPRVGAIHESPLQRPGKPRVGAIHESPLQRRKMLLAKTIGYFKMNTAKRINEIRGTPGRSLWQRNYYEHIIRNEDELEKIREYIRTNPLRWSTDPENRA